MKKIMDSICVLRSSAALSKINLFPKVVSEGFAIASKGHKFQKRRRMINNWMEIPGKEGVMNEEVTSELEEPLRMLALATENLLMVETLLKEIGAKLSQLKASPCVSGNLANNHPVNGFKKVNYPMDIIFPTTSAKERPASL